jgi:hypothetical protein
MMSPEEQKEWDKWRAARDAANIETKMMSPATEFKSRLLADYDAVMRARRDNPFNAVAEAFGWRALARPWAPAGIGAAMVMLGAVAGAATATARAAGEEEAVTYLYAALDPTYGLTEEALSWAEQ